MFSHEFSLFFIFSIQRSLQPFFSSQYCKLWLNLLHILEVMPIIIIYGYAGYSSQAIGLRQCNLQLPRGSTCLIKAHHVFILPVRMRVIAYPKVNLGLRLDHKYGLILELSELHTCTHYPVIALQCTRPSLHAYYGCTCILMTVTVCLQSSNLASITALMNNSSHTSVQLI